MGIVDDLLELCDAVVIAQPGVVDGSGTWAAAGSPVTLTARCEGAARLVRDLSGQQVVSSVLVLAMGLLASNDPATWRFTIPATFAPNASLQAIRIDQVSDESGPIYTEIALP